MNAKTFLFVGAWMKPLKTLPLEQRWNVMEAIAEYATTGHLTMDLDPMENLAFLFIRNEIDRMSEYRKATSERRRSAKKVQSEKDQKAESKEKIDDTVNATDANDTTDAYNTKDATDANACKAMQEDAPFDIISVSESVSESKSESNKKSSSTTRAHVRGNAITAVEFPARRLFLRHRGRRCRGGGCRSGGWGRGSGRL